MFNQHEIWRHRNCLDIDIFILKVKYNGPLYVKVKILYWNRHSHAFCALEPEVVKIYREEFPKWHLVENG